MASPSISGRGSCRGVEGAGCGRLVGLVYLDFGEQLEIVFTECVMVLAAVDDALDAHPDQGQNAAGDEQYVAGQPEPLQGSVGGVADELQRARVEVADIDRVVELQDPERQKGGEHHPGQSDV